MGGTRDIGTVRRLKIDVLTETGWLDDARFRQDMAKYGGSGQSQHRIAGDAANAGGHAALLTITSTISGASNRRCGTTSG